MLWTFDLWLYNELCNKYEEEFWMDYMCIRRDPFYLRVRTFFPFLLLIWGFWFLIYFFNSTYVILLLIVYIPIAIYSMYRITKWFLDYYMDFLIVIPDKVIRYNQSWIFSRKTVTLEKDNITSITVSQQWLDSALFNNWDIIVQWSGTTMVTIVFDRVIDPGQIESNMVRIINWNDTENS